MRDESFKAPWGRQVRTTRHNDEPHRARASSAWLKQTDERGRPKRELQNTHWRRDLAPQRGGVGCGTPPIQSGRRPFFP
jgi:hypothetical protein